MLHGYDPLVHRNSLTFRLEFPVDLIAALVKEDLLDKGFGQAEFREQFTKTFQNIAKKKLLEQIDRVFAYDVPQACDKLMQDAGTVSESIKTVRELEASKASVSLDCNFSFPIGYTAEDIKAKLGDDPPGDYYPLLAAEAARNSNKT